MVGIKAPPSVIVKLYTNFVMQSMEYAIILCGMLFLIPLSTILSRTHGLNVSTQNIEMAVLTLQ